ncbi:MAG: TlpA family protein disulfide reductase [Bacteroidales bacterium]|jgi:thiol-disulfide isomerase/thioredoxin|nr:TlpA family protein disulfide reductase [Bacteroidales bacterium]
MNTTRKIALSMLMTVITTVSVIRAQEVDRIGIPELEKILAASDDRLYVINFWATWCAPCVKELPHFEKISKEYKSDKVKFVLISLDFPSQVDKQLIPFLKKNKITLPVSVMTDLDYNEWIEKVDTSWQGNIPATLIFNKAAGRRLFIPDEVDEADLRKAIEEQL